MKTILLFLLLIPVLTAEVSKQAQILLKSSLEFNALGDYPSALSKYIEAYNVDQGILGLEDEGLLENGTKYFQQYLKNNPGDINSLMWLASIETLRGDYRAAIDHYQKVMHLSPNTPEALEADKEILRLEELIRNVQQAKEDRRLEENEKMEDLERIKTNVTRDVEDKYKKQITSLNEQIKDLEKEKRALRDETKKAQEEVQKLQEELNELKESNQRHRRLYLFYKKKAGVE